MSPVPRAVLVTGCSAGPVERVPMDVEPGFIRTGFSESAGSMAAGDDGRAGADAGPYRAFTAGVLAPTRTVYERGLTGRLGGAPEDVAGVVLDAITTEGPRARCPVTASARLLHLLRRALPDWAWDAFLARQFVRPGTSDG